MSHWKSLIFNEISFIFNFQNSPLSHIVVPFQFSSVQPLSCVWLFATPWTAARQASLFITNSQSPPKLMSIELVMPSNHLILCCPLLLLPSVFPSIRVFSNESVLRIRWPKYGSFSFSISPSNEYSGQTWYLQSTTDRPLSTQPSGFCTNMTLMALTLTGSTQEAEGALLQHFTALVQVWLGEVGEI